jgi:hypothetical protein
LAVKQAEKSKAPYGRSETQMDTVAKHSQPTLSPEVREQVEAVANADAEIVAGLMNTLKSQPIGRSADPQPCAEVFLGMAVWCRVRKWEQAGLVQHRSVGVPESDRILALTLALFSNSDPFLRRIIQEFHGQALSIAIGSSVWTAPALIGSPLLWPNSDVDDELILDAVAKFLWQTRGHQQIKVGGKFEME